MGCGGGVGGNCPPPRPPIKKNDTKKKKGKKGFQKEGEKREGGGGRIKINVSTLVVNFSVKSLVGSEKALENVMKIFTEFLIFRIYG